MATRERIDCTYTNEQEVPNTDPPAKKGLLQVRKVSVTKVGTFPVTTSGPGSYSNKEKLTTDEVGVDVGGDVQKDLAAGKYRIEEELPNSSNGEWDPTLKFDCIDQDHKRVKTDGSGLARTIDVDKGEGVVCLISNSFTWHSNLIIRARTIGGTSADIPYALNAVDSKSGQCEPWPDPPGVYRQTADTTGNSDGDNWYTAKPNTDEDVTRGVKNRTWCMQGAPSGSGWTTKSVECTGDIDYDAPNVAFPAESAAIVRPKDGGTVTCDFVYEKAGRARPPSPAMSALRSRRNRTPSRSRSAR